MGFFAFFAWISYFLGGAFLANAVPHLVNGVSGRTHQTPFAKPAGEGLSSSTVNVLWAFANLAVGWLLTFKAGLDLGSLVHVFFAGSGALVISVLLAKHFGKFHGGNSPPPEGKIRNID